MTIGKMLRFLSECAGGYYKKAGTSMESNRHMNKLTNEDIKIDKKTRQRIAEAVIVDFINYIGGIYNVDFAIYTRDLPLEFKKFKQAKRTKESENGR